MAIPNTRFKNLDPETRQKILELSEEMGTRKIAERLGISRRIIRKILEQPPGPDELSRKLDSFLIQIEQKAKAGLTTTRILREIQTLGYQGGRTTLAQHVSRIRAQLSLGRRKKVRRRFETPPGLEMQIDWSPGKVLIAGKLTKIEVLGIVLASSRKLFYSIFHDERQPRLLEGLALGFEYFAGSALRCVFDYVTGNIIVVMCPVSLCGR